MSVSLQATILCSVRIKVHTNNFQSKHHYPSINRKLGTLSRRRIGTGAGRSAEGCLEHRKKKHRDKRAMPSAQNGCIIVSGQRGRDQAEKHTSLQRMSCILRGWPARRDCRGRPRVPWPGSAALRSAASMASPIACCRSVLSVIVIRSASLRQPPTDEIAKSQTG